MLEEDFDSDTQELYDYDYFAKVEEIPQRCEPARFIRVVISSFRIRKHWVNTIPEDIQ